MPTPKAINNKAKKPPPVKPKPFSTPTILNNREPLEVYGRLRPMKDCPESDIIANKVSDDILEIAPLSSSSMKYKFKFKYIFDAHSSQEEVFNTVAKPLVQDLIHAKNGLIFTYGITGSGKTHTITGTPQNCGILPRVLDMIFNTLEKNNLQSFPYIFKSDSQNGFSFACRPDIAEKMQNNLIINQKSTPKKKKIIENNGWQNRVKDESFVKDINCDQCYGVFISYVEIYNNYIYDLLDEQLMEGCNGNRFKRSKRIMEDSTKRYYVQGAKEVEARNANEACELILKGMDRRRTASTSMNSDSSRSHAIFTIRVVQAPLELEGVLPIEDKKLIRIGQLSIVDLAGCERANKTKAAGDRLKEANSINNSLLTLRKCFDYLRENQKGASKLIPYRDSKLTHLFKSYFEGDGIVKMIICINPNLNDYEEIIQVCKFAEKSSEITTKKSESVCRFPFKLLQTCESYVEYSALPLLTFPNFSDDDYEAISQMKKYYNEKENILKNFRQINIQNQMNVRDGIVEMENELAIRRQETQTLKMDLEHRENQLREYESRIVHLENQLELTEKNYREKENNLVNELIKTKEKLCESEEKVKIIKKEFANKLKNNILEIKKWTFESMNIKEEFDKLKGRWDEIELFFRDEDKMFDCFESPPQPCRTFNKTSKTPEFKLTQTSPKMIHNYVHPDNQPVINPRYRRSLSSGVEKWINHKSTNQLSLGTVFKPSVKNKKSVTKLKASDFMDKGASKYLLTHHVAIDNGTIETKVFKGDVIPTRAGGAQIIFKDIETLKQQSPLE